MKRLSRMLANRSDIKRRRMSKGTVHLVVKTATVDRRSGIIAEICNRIAKKNLSSAK